ncbi:AAA family ATPase [Schlesneria paludicola]|uniref:AAA family ATPase n=1 Tax=Schlesneria paludicola TaxID=360056 RepID=UPI0012FA7D18|nr:AAA family ATPase [Schlesneria paludicola]
MFNGDGLIGIDLDDCREPVSGDLAGWAQDIVECFKTYAEVSPSGTGVKLFVRGVLPEGFRKKHRRPEGGEVEAYDSGRFFTVTGQRLYGTPDDVKDRPNAVNSLARMLEGWKPEQPAPEPTPRKESSPVTGDHEAGLRRAKGYLANVPGAVSGSGGHNHTFVTTMKLAGFGLSADAMFDLLAEWNLRCEPPWSDTELRHKIDSALKSNPAPMPDRPREPVGDRYPDVDLSRIMGGGSQPLSSVVDKPQSASPIVIRKAGDLIRDFPALRSPILEGLIRRGETMNIIAAPKMGKSWLSMGLALSVVAGHKWLGRFWPTRGNVLIVDNELHPETSSHRLPVIASAMEIPSADYSDRLFIANLRGGLLDMNQLATQLIGLEAGTFSLIILDAWYRFQPTGSDENSNGDVSRLYNLLDSVASKLGCAFVCIHHSSKGNQSGKSVTDMGAGAGAQARAPDCHLAMRQHEQDGAVVVEAAVRSWAPIEPFCLRWKFPVWEPADDLDPKALRVENPRRERKQVDLSGLLHPKAMSTDQANQLKVLEILESLPCGETKSLISESAGLNNRVTNTILAAMLRDEQITKCMVQKVRKTPYDGFQITSAGIGVLERLRQLRQNA